MNDYVSICNSSPLQYIDFVFSNFYLEKKLKSDFIFISPTIMPYFEVKGEIAYDECDVGLKNFFEEIDKLLIRSLEIAPNVIFYLQRFNNVEELGSLFGKYFQDFHDSKPIHDSIDIELIYANNLMEGVLIYYGKDLVKVRFRSHILILFFFTFFLVFSIIIFLVFFFLFVFVLE